MGMMIFLFLIQCSVWVTLAAEGGRGALADHIPISKTSSERRPFEIRARTYAQNE
jgi:hypothetical protein